MNDVQWTTATNVASLALKPQNGVFQGITNSQTSTLSFSSDQMAKLKSSGGEHTFTCRIAVGDLKTPVLATQIMKIYKPGEFFGNVPAVQITHSNEVLTISGRSYTCNAELFSDVVFTYLSRNKVPISSLPINTSCLRICNILLIRHTTFYIFSGRLIISKISSKLRLSSFIIIHNLNKFVKHTRTIGTENFSIKIHIMTN